jgi:hypothetical protein
MTAPDLHDFESMVIARGAVLLAYYHPTSDLAQVSTLDRSANRDPIVWLARDQDLAEVRLTYVAPRAYWVVDQIYSPVVGLVRGCVDEGHDGQDRIHFNTAYYGDDGHKIGFSSDFMSWAESVATWLRRNFHRNKELDLYDGPEVARTISHRSATE